MNSEPYATAGKLIVIEGSDGAGKGTVAAGVLAEMRGRGVDIVQMREPGQTELGEKFLRPILKGQAGIEAPLDDRAEALLFAAARAQMVGQVLRPTLASGTWVLMDRYEGSTMVYQGIGRGLGMERMRDLSRFASDDLQPDVTVVLCVSEETAGQRRSARDGDAADRIESSGPDFMQRVAAGYSQLSAFDDRVVEISAEGSPGEVLAAAVAAIDRMLVS